MTTATEPPPSEAEVRYAEALAGLRRSLARLEAALERFGRACERARGER